MADLSSQSRSLNRPGQKTAMISSTARDLPEHRRMVLDACLRLGFRPIMMDHLAGQDRSATDVSIGMVEDADVYLGILAHAYNSGLNDLDTAAERLQHALTRARGESRRRGTPHSHRARRTTPPQ